MRKFLFPVASLLLILASCSKQAPVVQQDTKGIVSGFDIVLADVPMESWTYSDLDNNNYFVATVSMPEITEDVFDNGIVSVYRTYDYDSSNPVQIALPYVRVNEEYVEYTDGQTGEIEGEWVFYTETIDYEYSIGELSLYFRASDFLYELDTDYVPCDMQFRIVLIY